MKKIFLWLFMLFKRTIKKPVFLIISLITPIIAIGLTVMSENADVHVNIGIYSEDSSDFTSEIIDTLCNRDKIYTFIPTDSREELIRLTENGTVTCGYIFPENFEEKLHSAFSSNSSSNIIELIIPVNSSVPAISNEIFYSAVIRTYAYALLVDDIEAINTFKKLDKNLLNEKLSSYYNHYLNGDETFSFEYNVDTDGIPKKFNIYDYIKSPLRGIAAIIVFLTALCGGFVWDKDNKKGVFGLLGTKVRLILGYFDILIPTLISGIIASTTLFCVGISINPGKEITAMLLYILATSLFAFLLKTILADINVYTGTIPLFVMGSLVFCPVFINISTFIPMFRIIKPFFIPNLYFELIRLI